MVSIRKENVSDFIARGGTITVLPKSDKIKKELLLNAYSVNSHRHLAYHKGRYKMNNDARNLCNKAA